jgi:hypothetical protein
VGQKTKDAPAHKVEGGAESAADQTRPVATGSAVHHRPFRSRDAPAPVPPPHRAARFCYSAFSHVGRSAAPEPPALVLPQHARTPQHRVLHLSRPAVRTFMPRAVRSATRPSIRGNRTREATSPPSYFAMPHPATGPPPTLPSCCSPPPAQS